MLGALKNAEAEYGLLLVVARMICRGRDGYVRVIVTFAALYQHF